MKRKKINRNLVEFIRENEAKVRTPGYEWTAKHTIIPQLCTNTKILLLIRRRLHCEIISI